MKKIFTYLLILSSVFLIIGGGLVHAQTPGSGSTGGTPGSGGTGGTGGGGGTGGTGGSGSTVVPIRIDNPFKANVGGSLYGLIQNIMNNIILPVGGVLCVLAFIYAGFLYVTAQGSETQIGKANLALLYASIGTAVLLGSWVLANAICKTIGLLGGPVCTITL